MPRLEPNAGADVAGAAIVGFNLHLVDQSIDCEAAECADDLFAGVSGFGRDVADIGGIVGSAEFGGEEGDRYQLPRAGEAGSGGLARHRAEIGRVLHAILLCRDGGGRRAVGEQKPGECDSEYVHLSPSPHADRVRLARVRSEVEADWSGVEVILGGRTGRGVDRRTAPSVRFAAAHPSPSSDYGLASQDPSLRIPLPSCGGARGGRIEPRRKLVVLPTTSPQIQLAAHFLIHPAHLFHALKRGGLAGGGRFCAGGAGGDKAFDALILL